MRDRDPQGRSAQEVCGSRQFWGINALRPNRLLTAGGAE